MSKAKWYTRPVYVLVALALVFSFSLMPVAPMTGIVAAATINVNTTGFTNVTGFHPCSEPIQCAIDNATGGDTIDVAAGTYDEQVVIDKALTLQGAGDTTIIQPSDKDKLTKMELTPWISGGTKEMVAIVWADAAGASVTIKDLKVDGINVDAAPAVLAASGRIAGIAYNETSGTADNVTVVNMHTPTQLPRSVGIWASDNTGAASAVEVRYCNITNYNRGGIYGCGNNLTLDITHNTITGPGVSGTQVPNGIFFLAGCVGSATYNTVIACGYSGDTWRGTGIGTYDSGSGIIIGHNIITDLDNAVAIYGVGTVTIEYNNLTGSHTGVRLEGGADYNVIQYNNIENNTYAIRCDEDLGNNNTAHYNNFINNAGTGTPNYEGVVSHYDDGNGTAHTLDASNNWWGTTDVVVIDGMVSGNVTYIPIMGAPASEEGTGEFKVGDAPTVTVTFTPANMTPQIEQTVTVNINTDGWNLTDLTDITLKVWYDANGGAPTEDEFNASAANVNNCGIITWNNATGFASILPGSTTWANGTCSAPALDATSGNFTFEFDPGKVARETTGGASWQIAASATGRYPRNFGFDAEGADMLWYPEISLVPASLTVSWGIVPPGLDWSGPESNQSLNATITYISNGDYTEKVKSSANWTSGSDNATLDDTGACGSAQEFSLMADIDDTLAGAVLVDVTGVVIASEAITVEAGNAEASNTLWLKLGSPFSPYLYTGTISYNIAHA